MLGLLLLLASSARADVVRATLRVEGDRVELVHAAQLPGEAPSVDGELAILDAAGAEVGRAALPPLARHRSVLLPDGHQTARVDSPYVRVTLPWPTGARLLKVGERVLDVAASPRLHRQPAAGAATAVLGDGPPERRLDLLFLSEGYTADRADAFAAHVDAVVDHLLTVEPWASYGGLLDVWRAFVPSDDAGIDDPARAKDVDTPFSCAYGCALDVVSTDRLICCDEGAVLAEVDAVAPFADGVMVLVDDTKYGGSGGLTYSVSHTGDETALLVATHELGHTLVGLWDEYDYGTTPDPASRYVSPNCGAQDEAVPWTAWLDDGPIAWPLWHAAQDLDDGPACDGRPSADDPDAICAFPSCSFTDFVRPTRGACMMNVLGQPYCPVCREAVVRALYRSVGEDRVVRADPPVGSEVRVEAGGTRAFHVEALGPDAGLTYTWRHDGRVVHEGPDLVVGGDTPVCGTLELTVADPTTWVRGDADGLLSQTVQWDVRAGPCCGCATLTPLTSLPALLAGLAALRRRAR